MSKCTSIDPLVTPYVDGELSAAERTLVDEHLHRCPPCHSRVAAEAAVRDLVRARKPDLTARAGVGESAYAVHRAGDRSADASAADRGGVARSATARGRADGVARAVALAGGAAGTDGEPGPARRRRVPVPGDPLLRRVCWPRSSPRIT